MHTPIAREVSAATAVIVERRLVGGPWQAHAWRPVAVEFDHVGGLPWRVLRNSSESVLVRIGNVPMTLHAKEMMGYKVNFANGEPRIYIALQLRDFDPDEPVSIDLVTASALEVQAYGHTSESVTDSVSMPLDMRAWVEEFMASQVPDQEQFIKRGRDRAPSGEDFKFGNIAIEQLRKDALRRDPSEPAHPALRAQNRRS